MLPRSLRAVFVAALTAAAVSSTPAQSLAASAAPAKSGHYQNFAVAIYIPAAVVQHFAEPNALETEWERISSQVKVDKVYIESHRDRSVVDEALLEKTKAFFVSRGVRTAGGITWTDTPIDGQFRSFCYTDPKDRAFVKHVSEMTARHFDEIILDDFFFVTTKLESDIAAKGSRSWTQFRLELMNGAARELIVGPAKAVNPKVKVVVKYPNWYEHFAGMGFDLAEEPKIFDGIYTGTETRDPTSTDQYLQPYESYEIIRYFDNIAPGRNGGGWVDTFSIKDVDRYAEQLWDTLFAKTPEITLFFWGGLLAPIQPGNREAWAAQSTSFNYGEMLKYSTKGAIAEGPQVPWEVSGLAAGKPPTMARVAGYALDHVDRVVGQLGKPIGIASYRPPHGRGEDFLQNYLGMLGIPIEMTPTFPENAELVLLTEHAKDDAQLVGKIKQQLLAGKSVVITSGLAKALQGHGLEDILELETTERRFLADGYSVGFFGNRDAFSNHVTGAPEILFPQIGFLTNDSWALVSAMSDGTGYPLLLVNRYGAKGQLYVWTMPDNFRQLYRIPSPVITAIKNVIMKGFRVRLNGPSEVALFAYDNQTVVVHSYLPNEAAVKLGALKGGRLRDLRTGEVIQGTPTPPPSSRWQAPEEPRTWFNVSVPAHSYRAFAIEP